MNIFTVCFLYLLQPNFSITNLKDPESNYLLIFCLKYSFTIFVTMCDFMTV